MKKIFNLFLTGVLAVSMLVINTSGVSANTDESVPEIKWKTTINEYGEIEEVLDMTEDEIQQYQINQLKKKYEKTRDDGYTYEYTLIENTLDTGTDTLKYILIGYSTGWGHHLSFGKGQEYGFSLTAPMAYFGLTMSYKKTISETFSSYYTTKDSCLGIYARVNTNKYRVKKIAKYSGVVVSTYEEYNSYVTNKTYRATFKDAGTNAPVYFVYKINNVDTHVRSRIIKPSLNRVPISSADFIDANSGNFNVK